MSDRAMPERKSVKQVLRDLGLTTRQVDALLRSGWRGLVGETQAERDELRERLVQLVSKVGT